MLIAKAAVAERCAKCSAIAHTREAINYTSDCRASWFLEELGFVSAVCVDPLRLVGRQCGVAHRGRVARKLPAVAVGSEWGPLRTSEPINAKRKIHRRQRQAKPTSQAKWGRSQPASSTSPRHRWLAAALLGYTPLDLAWRWCRWIFLLALIGSDVRRGQWTEEMLWSPEELAVGERRANQRQDGKGNGATVEPSQPRQVTP